MPALEPAPERRRSFVLEPIQGRKRKAEQFPGHLQAFNRSPSKLNNRSRRLKTGINARRQGKKKSNEQNQAGSRSDELWDASDNAVDMVLENVDQSDCAGVFHERVQEPGEGDVGSDAYQWFVSLVGDGYLGFIRISNTLFMVQGFDLDHKEGTDHWYHFQARQRGAEMQLTCLCPRGAQRCLHKKFYEEFKDSWFRVSDEESEEEPRGGDPSVVLFSRRLVGIEGDTLLLRFSVEGDSGAVDARSRSIVTYEGNHNGDGRWSCVKDMHMTCMHKKKALALMVRDLGWEGDLDADPSAARMYMAGVVDDANVGGATEKSISYLPILPPEWASLPTDKNLYPRPDPRQDVISVLRLSECSRSACGTHSWKADRPVVERECQIYTLTERLTRVIELQECPSCPAQRQCWIGPDPRQLGLFNYNNSALFTHELLDEYTNHYTSSETPFVAFVLCLGRIYETRGCRFVGEDLFRSAWFAFADLQLLENDMWCPECGPYPESVIWDGVTLAFGKKHLRSSLAPPTQSGRDSPRRPRKRVSAQQWLAVPDEGKRKVRARLLKWIKRWGSKPTRSRKECVAGRFAGLMSQAFLMYDTEDASEEDSEGQSTEDDQEEGRRWSELDEILDALKLAGFDTVANLLHVVFGRNSSGMDWRIKRRYKILFEQLASDDSVLQMVTVEGLQHLNAFVARPSRETATMLVAIPSLMILLESSLNRGRQQWEMLVSLSSWMLKRASEVWERVKGNQGKPLEEIVNASDGADWRQVSH
ncbi:hypothetical protein VNI00_006462 [Paramarasmius palmivorus]|uniref:HMG domain-containing protein n=1 Tax=Paramarasmius palmivorus TaxID=297713 RepID=A0AAW0D8C3_9AGAR